MGRRTDSDDDRDRDGRRRHKHKKHSRSTERTENPKSKHRSDKKSSSSSSSTRKERSRSPNRDRSRRSRSRSRGHRRSKSLSSERSDSRKSKQRSEKKLPASYRQREHSPRKDSVRHSSSRSYERRRSRSTSRSRGRRTKSRSPVRSKKARRSRSRSRRDQSPPKAKDPFGRDRRRSRERSYSKSPLHPLMQAQEDLLEIEKEKEKKKGDPCADVPGFAEMTPGDQARLRMQKALEAAASADAALREKGLLGKEKLSVAQQMHRQQVLEDIEDDDFTPAAFMSGRDTLEVSASSLGIDYSHDKAMFGGSNVALGLAPKSTPSTTPSGIVYKDRGPLASHSLFASAEEKEERWIQKLEKMRREKLAKYRALHTKQENYA